MKKFLYGLGAAAVLLSTNACLGLGDYQSDVMYPAVYYVNQFAYNTIGVYYLWAEDALVQNEMRNWRTDDDPAAKVLKLRYKDEKGNDIDRWTQMTDSYTSFVGAVDGVSKTYGYDFLLYATDNDKVVAVVSFIYEDSPAAKVGLKRGDAITSVNGTELTKENYVKIVNENMLAGDSCTLGLIGGGTISMNAVEMYCNPVLLVKTFDCEGKKVGYLHFTSFTQESCSELIAACDKLKAEGISELILDLRYNGGGYVFTEELLASMLAPESAVSSKSLFMTEVYNSTLTKEWTEEGKSYFSTSFKYEDKTYDTSHSNLGITKLYAIMSSGSASASEALICGLKPYMDVTIVGEQSHGKFCSGVILKASEWYETYKEVLTPSDYKYGVSKTEDWGIYVMIGRYADKDGNTLSMPSGLTPDIEVSDEPSDGYQLGDPRETMLRKALTLAGYDFSDVPATSAMSGLSVKVEKPQRPGFGVFLHENL